jgi:predicted protein tyrosine phosphatase
MSNTKLLFVCSGGLDRSPTAEEIVNTEFSDKFKARSCGLYPLTHSAVLTREVLKWADIVIVMEPEHKRDILERFFLLIRDKPDIIVFNVPNSYVRNDPELKKLLREKIATFLGDL